MDLRLSPADGPVITRGRKTVEEGRVLLGALGLREEASIFSSLGLAYWRIEKESSAGTWGMLQGLVALLTPRYTIEQRVTLI